MGSSEERSTIKESVRSPTGVSILFTSVQVSAPPVEVRAKVCVEERS